MMRYFCKLWTCSSHFCASFIKRATQWLDPQFWWRGPRGPQLWVGYFYPMNTIVTRCLYSWFKSYSWFIYPIKNYKMYHKPTCKKKHSELGVTVGSPTSRFRYHGRATCTDFETLGRAARAAPWSWALGFGLITDVFFLLGWWRKMGNLLGCFFNWDNGRMVNYLVIRINYLDVWPFTMIIPNDCEFREFAMG